jgi:hypothetical protein
MRNIKTFSQYLKLKILFDLKEKQFSIHYKKKQNKNNKRKFFLDFFYEI